MPNLTRRHFIAATLAAGSLRALPQIARTPGARRIVTLVYDKGLGAMRLIERTAP